MRKHLSLALALVLCLSLLTTGALAAEGTGQREGIQKSNRMMMYSNSTNSTRTSSTSTNLVLGVDTFSFNNSSGPFGNEYYLSDEHADYLKAKSFVRFYTEMAINYGGAFEGACFGMSTVMGFLQTNRLEHSAIQGGANSTWELDAPVNNKTLASWINYYQMLQSFGSLRSEDKFKSQRALVQELVETLYSGGEPVVVQLKLGLSNHAVLAYEVQRHSDSDNLTVMIADPNQMYMINGQPCIPSALMSVDGSTFEIQYYLLQPIGGGDLADSTIVYGNGVEIKQVITLDTILEESDVNIIHQAMRSLQTNSSDFIIRDISNGTQAVIHGGIRISGDMNVYGPDSEALGFNDNDIYTYYFESDGDIEIEHLDVSNTLFTAFYDEQDNGVAVETSNNRITFFKNGGVGLSGSEGRSLILTSTYGTIADCQALLFETDSKQIRVEPQNNAMKVSSNDDVSRVSITGFSNWEEIKTEVNLTEELVISNKNSTLTITNQENALLKEIPMTYAVVFISNGGTFVDAQTELLNNSKVQEPNNPEREGFVFAGWFEDIDLTEKWDFTSDTITGNTYLYAKWIEIPHEEVPPAEDPSVDDNKPVSNIPKPNDIIISENIMGGQIKTSLSNASKGATITVTATPDEGYHLVYITVDDERISGTSFEMPDHAVEVSAVFERDGEEPPFTDVEAGDWFYEYVQYVYENGLMDGVSDTLFNPDGNMTRAMFWAVLARIDGETVTGDTWMEDARAWAMESGVSDGTEPEANVTREMLVTMLYRYAGLPETDGSGAGIFDDGETVSVWAYDAMSWALNNGVITGVSDDMLLPGNTATRAQCAAILMRYMELQAE